jgi:hypothetical protein
MKFEPVGSFRGKVGESVILEVHRGASVLEIPVRPVDLEPTKMFLRGLESSARVLESNGRPARHTPSQKIRPRRPRSQARRHSFEDWRVCRRSSFAEMRDIQRDRWCRRDVQR